MFIKFKELDRKERILVYFAGPSQISSNSIEIETPKNLKTAKNISWRNFN